MTELFLSSLRQNILTKTNAQINDCLSIYMKLKAITVDHALQHVPDVSRKEWFVCACGVLDGRPRLQKITFDGISLLEAGNTNKSICLCLIIQVWVVTKLDF